MVGNTLPARAGAVHPELKEECRMATARIMVVECRTGARRIVVAVCRTVEEEDEGDSVLKFNN